MVTLLSLLAVLLLPATLAEDCKDGACSKEKGKAGGCLWTYTTISITYLTFRALDEEDFLCLKRLVKILVVACRFLLECFDRGNAWWARCQECY